MAKKPTSTLTVATLTHDEASRVNIPTAEYQSVMRQEEQTPVRVAYARRNRDLDPQLVWRGKDEQDGSDLVVHAPPLYIQEKVHPKVLIDDLRRHSVNSGACRVDSEKRSSLSPNHYSLSTQIDLFADFNGLPDDNARTEFYRHEGHWSNRMILGDSLQVMASLAEREGLRGKVQCIYFDPPYGIKFNSNFQWSTTSRDVKDGKADHITREPEQVKAFRDTWRDGIHSYLTYLRDRLTVARDLLTDSGSIFVQIGDENVHRVRAVMDEVFGEDNCIAQITIEKTSSQTQDFLSPVTDYVLWFAKSKVALKFRSPWLPKQRGQSGFSEYSRLVFADLSRRSMTSEEKANADSIPSDVRVYRQDNLTSQSLGREKGEGAASWFPVSIEGTDYRPSITNRWKTSEEGMRRLGYASRLEPRGSSLSYVRFIDDFPAIAINNIWSDVKFSSRAEDKTYIVQTSARTVQRCILMSTDPGDLVLDPTCGSGTTATVAEQWGRRWITIDTSRVALALARARLMGARYPFYLLADSRDGQRKEAELRRVNSGQGLVDSKERPALSTSHSSLSTGAASLRLGFVYERVPHITLKSIANNAEIEVIWDQWQAKLEPLRKELNEALGTNWQEWEIPRELSADYADGRRLKTAEKNLRKSAKSADEILKEWWAARIARQREIDASIAAQAEFEFLYDKPYQDKKKVRVAGPFTVESLSPHRVLGVDENDELIDKVAEPEPGYGEERDFVQMILENLKTAGVQQAHKEDRISFTSLTAWPGYLICAEGRYEETHPHPSPLPEGEGTKTEKRAGIFIGPEFGTVNKPDLVEAARECAEAGFDVLVACAFNYDVHTSEFSKLGRIPVLKARMNADLHMAEDLKNTGKGNLFVIFGEPDITVASEEWLVDSSGNRVAPYEIFKLVSGTDRLAEINGLGSDDLRAYARVSNRGEIWDYIANASGVDIHSGKHRRRAGTPNNGGVSAIAWHCAGITGRTGNVSDLIREAGVANDAGFRALVERLRRDQQDASRTHEIAIHSPLTTIHYSQVTIHGVDVFHPNTGEVRSDGPEGIACWFLDTDYNEESFFVRHAYFLGANDPYKALKTTLKAEIDPDAWASLNSAISRPFEKPTSGRIAVKVINHLGDEVMKVFRV